MKAFEQVTEVEKDEKASKSSDEASNELNE